MKTLGKFKKYFNNILKNVKHNGENILVKVLEKLSFLIGEILEKENVYFPTICKSLRKISKKLYWKYEKNSKVFKKCWGHSKEGLEKFLGDMKDVLKTNVDKILGKFLNFLEVVSGDFNE